MIRSIGLAFLYGALCEPPAIPGFTFMLSPRTFAIASRGGEEFFIRDLGEAWLLVPRLANGRADLEAVPIFALKPSASSAPLR